MDGAPAAAPEVCLLGVVSETDVARTNGGVVDPTNYVRAESFSLARHPTFNEKWVQDQIRNDTALLGLGKLDVRDVERMQPKAGRLDLLLQDPESDRRYTVRIPPQSVGRR